MHTVVSHCISIVVVISVLIGNSIVNVIWGVLSMCCVCASVVEKFNRIRVVVIRVVFAVRRVVSPFLDVCCFPFATAEH